MNVSKELLYTKSHEWVLFTDDTTAKMGLTDYAQGELGDLVFVNLPEPGDDAVIGEAFADVESVKAVSDVYSPVSGKIAQVNEELLDVPALINTDPYGAWLVEISDITEKDELLSPSAYEQFCTEEG